jgi:hypothetical protein
MTDDLSAEPIERWTVQRRATLILSILKRETSVVEAARRQGVTVAEIEDWREQFRPGKKPIENAFIESFNGRLRDECLNVNVFVSLAGCQGEA